MRRHVTWTKQVSSFIGVICVRFPADFPRRRRKEAVSTGRGVWGWWWGSWQELQRKGPCFLLEGRLGAIAEPRVLAAHVWEEPVRGNLTQSLPPTRWERVSSTGHLTGWIRSIRLQSFPHGPLERPTRAVGGGPHRALTSDLASALSPSLTGNVLAEPAAEPAVRRVVYPACASPSLSL